MPRNGSGIYTPPAGTTAVPNTTIESADFNSVVADMGQALTDSLNVNGTAPLQANQPMGGFKLTGMGAGSAAGDSANLGQVQSDIVAHATAVGGTADAITLTFPPPFTAYTAKMRFRFTAGGANTITNPTVNVDGLGAKTIKKLNGQALAAGNIAGSGHICDCVYDGTDVMLVNLNSVAAASETAQGIIELATTAEARAGIDTGRAIVPVTLAAFARLKLSGNTTLYVRTDGNDSHDGSANTSGSAVLTVQKAIDLAAALDLAGYTLTIQIGNGTYTGANTIPALVGAKSADNFVIQGDTGTPGNVIISTTSATCFTAAEGAMATIQGVELRATTSGDGINVTRGAVIKYGAMNFGAVAGRHLVSTFGGKLKGISNYTINGNAARHFSAVNAGIIDAPSLSITLSGSRAFTAWAGCSENSYINVIGTTYTGSATGNRGVTSSGGGFDTGGTTQPGNAGPTTTTPGWAT